MVIMIKKINYFILYYNSNIKILINKALGITTIPRKILCVKLLCTTFVTFQVIL
jgi:hypothetical protein